MGEQVFEVVHQLFELGVFGLDFIALEAGQLVETHVENGFGLNLAEAEFFHQAFLRFVAVFGVANDADDFIHVIHGEQEAFEDMCAGFCLVEVELRAAGDHLEAVVDEALEHLFEVHYARFAVVDGEHDGAEGGFHLCVFVDGVEHYARHGGSFEFDYQADAFFAGLVADVGNAVEHLVAHQVNHFLNQQGFVQRIGDLGDDDAGFTVIIFFDFGFAAHFDFAAAGGVEVADRAETMDHAAGREVGAFDVFAKVFDGCFRVVDQVNGSVYHFAEVVRRNVGGHSDRDSG